MLGPAVDLNCMDERGEPGRGLKRWEKSVAYRSRVKVSGLGSYTGKMWNQTKLAVIKESGSR